MRSVVVEAYLFSDIVIDNDADEPEGLAAVESYLRLKRMHLWIAEEKIECMTDAIWDNELGIGCLERYAVFVVRNHTAYACGRGDASRNDTHFANEGWAWEIDLVTVECAVSGSVGLQVDDGKICDTANCIIDRYFHRADIGDEVEVIGVGGVFVRIEKTLCLEVLTAPLGYFTEGKNVRTIDDEEIVPGGCDVMFVGKIGLRKGGVSERAQECNAVAVPDAELITVSYEGRASEVVETRHKIFDWNLSSRLR